MTKVNQLRIKEIFTSLQGESVNIGLPTVFIRLTGCPLRCQYCDTAYAFKGGKNLTIPSILEEVAKANCAYVCVTGGEPLAQPACIDLLKALCDANYNVSLETSGALDIAKVDDRVMVVMDLKTPDSKESAKNYMNNLVFIKKSDQIKFVLCSENDYIWACNLLEEYQLDKKTQILFSPSYQELNPTLLADWIVRDRLPVRFQLQLHKILWNDAPGH